MNPPRAPELMRQQNRNVILETIEEGGPISCKDLAHLLNLNPATVTRITRVLLEEDLICETGEGESQRAGRKPVMLSFNHRARLLIGTHITAREISAVIADMAGTVLTRRTLLAPNNNTAETLLALFEDLLAADPSYTRRLAAASVNHFAPQTPDIVDTLSVTFNMPVLTATEAVLAAIGEIAWGTAQDQTHFALLYLGTHSGSCSYLDGMFRAGGLGITPQGEPLSARLCDQGLIAQARDLLGTDTASALHSLNLTDRLSVSRIIEAARQRDPVALTVVHNTAHDIAHAALWLANLLALDLVILAGAWQSAADVLIPAINDHLADLHHPTLAVVPAALGSDAALLGAVQWALNQLDITFQG